MSLALDTNVLVRFLTRDDMRQLRAAERLLSENTTLVLDTVVLELEWVLRKAFRYEREQIAAMFEVMLASTGMDVESPGRLASALRGYRSGLDFADAFHLAGAASSSAFATFDRDFAKQAPSVITEPPVLFISDQP